MTPDLHRTDVQPIEKAPKLSKRKRTERLWQAKKQADVALREEVLMRSNGDCEVRSEVCTGRVEHVHHVLRRAQGGAYDLDLVLGTCFACHHHLHFVAPVAEAYAKGWLCRSTAPRSIP